MPFDPRKPIGNAKHSTLFSFFWTWSIYGVLFGTPSVFIAVNESIHPLNLQSFLRHYIIAFENIINFFQIIFEPISILIIRIFELININLEYSDHWVPIFLIASLAFGCIIRGILAITKKYEEIKFVIYAYVLCFIGCFILGFSKSFDNIFWQGFVSLAPFGLISIPALILIFLYHVLSRTALDRNLTLRNARIEISIKKRAPELRRAYEVLSEDIQSTFTRFKHDKRAIPPIKEEELSETDILKKMERNISPIYSESMKLYFHNRDSYIDHIRRKHLFIFESFKNKHEKQMNEFDVIKKNNKSIKDLKSDKSMTMAYTLFLSSASFIYITSLLFLLIIKITPLLKNDPTVSLIMIQMTLLGSFYIMIGITKDDHASTHFGLMLVGAITGLFVVLGLDRALMIL